MTTPLLAFEGPLAAEIVEVATPSSSVTVLPVTAMLFSFNRVTVIVEELVPSFKAEVGLATTVERAADARFDTVWVTVM